MVYNSMINMVSKPAVSQKHDIIVSKLILTTKGVMCYLG